MMRLKDLRAVGDEFSLLDVLRLAYKLEVEEIAAVIVNELKGGDDDARDISNGRACIKLSRASYERLTAIKNDLKKRYGRNVTYTEVIDYLIEHLSV